jgi:hypothetical protein
VSKINGGCGNYTRNKRLSNEVLCKGQEGAIGLKKTCEITRRVFYVPIGRKKV